MTKASAYVLTLGGRKNPGLKLATAGYVAALVCAHAALPETATWQIAFFFLAAMLFTYPVAALYTGASHTLSTLETALSLGLAGIGFLGLWISPLFLIAAIALHGAWDIAKHAGAGVPFFSWYCLGCAAVDFAYATALLLYISHGN